MIAAAPGNGINVNVSNNTTDDVEDGPSPLSLLDQNGIKWSSFIEQLDAPGHNAGDMTTAITKLYMVRHMAYVTDFEKYNIGTTAATRYGHNGSVPNGSYVMDAGLARTFPGLSPGIPSWPN